MATTRTNESSNQTGIAGAIARIRHGVTETVSELRKVAWPDSDTTRNLTLVVIGISAAIGVLLGGADALLTTLYKLLEKIGA